MGRSGTRSAGASQMHAVPRRTAEPEPKWKNYAGEGDPVFGHPAERELAKVLDYYGLPWMYEPRFFPLMVKLPGGEEVVYSDDLLVDGKLPADVHVSFGFQPDFYLPESGIYLECTMMKQSLTTRKNRKIRMVQQLYGIRVKKIYRRDFEILAARFNLDMSVLDPADAEAAA